VQPLADGERWGTPASVCRYYDSALPPSYARRALDSKP
jgi:hypothetical protein